MKDIIMAANKKTALQKIRDQYESISKEDLTALAYNKCQSALEKLYKSNIQAMKDLETKSKEVAALESKIANFEKKEKEIVADYLTGFTDLKAMIQSESNREDLKKKAAAGLKGSTNDEARKSWTPYSLVQQLTKEEACDEGWLSFKAIKGHFNAPSIDVLVKRLQCKSDEMLKRMEKDAKSVEVKIDKSFKVAKSKTGKAFDYYFNKQDVIDRLMETDKYKEEAAKVRS
jgi:hypothetical protein